MLDDERQASYTFLSRILREDKDKAFIIHFDREVELLQDLTSSRDKLSSALLQALQTPSMDDQPQAVEAMAAARGGGTSGGGQNIRRWRISGRRRLPRWLSRGWWLWGGGGLSVAGAGHRGGGYPGGGGGGGVAVAGVLECPALFSMAPCTLVSDELMSKQQGRKAVIILSDGVDTGSKFPLERAVEASQRADTIVYSILFSDESAYGGGFGGFGGLGRHRWRTEPPDGKKVLEEFPEETGGRILKFQRSCRLRKSTARSKKSCAASTASGYSPDSMQVAAGYHKIVVKTKANLVVGPTVIPRSLIKQVCGITSPQFSRE